MHIAVYIYILFNVQLGIRQGDKLCMSTRSLPIHLP